MPSSVWGPKAHQATWRIYDTGLELHTLDFSSNRSISTWIQACHKSPWWEHEKREKPYVGLCGLVSDSEEGFLRLYMHLLWKQPHVMLTLGLQLQCTRLDGVVHLKAVMNTTRALCQATDNSREASQVATRAAFISTAEGAERDISASFFLWNTKLYYTWKMFPFDIVDRLIPLLPWDDGQFLCKF